MVKYGFKLHASGYTEWKFNSELIERNVNRVKRVLTKIGAAGVTFDGVAVMGTSGSWMGALLVMAGYRVVLVRKGGDRSHGSPVEASHGKYFRLVFVDDFVISGTTVGVARDIIRSESNQPEFRFEGIVLYDQSYSESLKIDNQQVYGYDY